MSEAEYFEGHQPRNCGEHRTVGAHRAWCYDCQEWCYPASPCVRCEEARKDALLAEVAEVLRAFPTGPIANTRVINWHEERVKPLLDKLEERTG